MKQIRKIISIVCALAMLMSVCAVCFGTFAGAVVLTGAKQTYTIDFKNEAVQNLYRASGAAAICDYGQRSGVINEGLVVTSANNNSVYDSNVCTAAMTNAYSNGTTPLISSNSKYKPGMASSSHVANTAGFACARIAKADGSGFMTVDKNANYEMTIHFKIAYNANAYIDMINDDSALDKNTSYRVAFGIGADRSETFSSQFNTIDGTQFNAGNAQYSASSPNNMGDRNIDLKLTFSGSAALVDSNYAYADKYLQFFVGGSSNNATVAVIDSIDVTVMATVAAAYYGNEPVQFLNGTETLADINGISNAAGEPATWVYRNGTAVGATDVIDKDIYATFPESEVVRHDFSSWTGISLTNCTTVYKIDPADSNNVIFGMQDNGTGGNAWIMGKDKAQTIASSSNNAATLPDATKDFVFSADTKYTITYKMKLGAGAYGPSNVNSIATRFNFFLWSDDTHTAGGRTNTPYFDNLVPIEDRSILVNEQPGAVLYAPDWVESTADDYSAVQDGKYYKLADGVTTGRYRLTEDTAWKTVTLNIDTSVQTYLVDSYFGIGCYTGGGYVPIFIDDVAIVKHSENTVRALVNNNAVSYSDLANHPQGIVFNVPTPVAPVGDSFLGWFDALGNSYKNGDVITEAVDIYAVFESELTSGEATYDLTSEAYQTAYAAKSTDMTGIDNNYGLGANGYGLVLSTLIAQYGNFIDSAKNVNYALGDFSNNSQAEYYPDGRNFEFNSTTKPQGFPFGLFDGAMIKDDSGNYVAIDSTKQYTVTVNYKYLNNSDKAVTTRDLQSALGSGASATSATSFRSFFGLGCSTTTVMQRSSASASDPYKVLGLVSFNRGITYGDAVATFKFDGSKFAGEYLRIVVTGGANAAQGSYFAVQSVTVCTDSPAVAAFKAAPKVFAEGEVIARLGNSDTLASITDVKNSFNESPSKWVYKDGTEVGESETITADIYAIFPTTKLDFETGVADNMLLTKVGADSDLGVYVTDGTDPIAGGTHGGCMKVIHKKGSNFYNTKVAIAGASGLGGVTSGAFTPYTVEENAKYVITYDVYYPFTSAYASITVRGIGSAGSNCSGQSGKDVPITNFAESSYIIKNTGASGWVTISQVAEFTSDTFGANPDNNCLAFAVQLKNDNAVYSADQEDIICYMDNITVRRITDEKVWNLIEDNKTTSFIFSADGEKLPVPTKAGSVFAGWSTNTNTLSATPSCQNIVMNATPVTVTNSLIADRAVLYPIWTTGKTYTFGTGEGDYTYQDIGLNTKGNGNTYGSNAQVVLDGSDYVLDINSLGVASNGTSTRLKGKDGNNYALRDGVTYKMTLNMKVVDFHDTGDSKNTVSIGLAKGPDAYGYTALGGANFYGPTVIGNYTLSNNASMKDGYANYEYVFTVANQFNMGLNGPLDSESDFSYAIEKFTPYISVLTGHVMIKSITIEPVVDPTTGKAYNHETVVIKTNGVVDNAGGTVQIDYATGTVTPVPAEGYKLAANGIKMSYNYYAPTLLTIAKDDTDDVKAEKTAANRAALAIGSRKYAMNKDIYEKDADYFESDTEGGVSFKSIDTTYVGGMIEDAYRYEISFVSADTQSSELIAKSAKPKTTGNGAARGIRLRGRVSWNSSITEVGFIITNDERGTNANMQFTDGTLPTGVISRIVYSSTGSEVLYSKSATYRDYQVFLYGISDANKSANLSVRMYVVDSDGNYSYSPIEKTSFNTVYKEYSSDLRNMLWPDRVESDQ